MARSVGISESTITKGLKDNNRPSPNVRGKVQLFLEAERRKRSEGFCDE